jgi:FkbM family methyltransferase
MLVETLEHLATEIHVADVGAADLGEVAPYQPLLDAGLARLTAFEPDEREAAGLADKLGARATLLPYALGDGEEHTLHVCGPGLGMTSLLEPDPDSLAFFNMFEEWGRVERTVPCPTRRLDDLDELDPIDYLKIDVQGSELSILSNGREKLRTCLAIQTEISFVALYRDQPTFGEIDQELRAQGLMPHRFAHIKTWSIKPTTRFGDPRSPFDQLLEADIVYVRDIVRADDVPDGDLAKLALVAQFAYRSPDLAARCLAVLVDRGAIEPDSRERYYEWLAGISG